MAKIVNVETVFLYWDFEEEIYMECPQKMSDITKDDCIISNKCIYSLVQAACQYYKKAVEILKSSGFVRGSIDSCLYVKKSMRGIVYIALYIEDNLMIGNIAAIDNSIKALKSNWLVLKIVEGCRIICPAKSNFPRIRSTLD